jgi:hypothetical protein
LLSEGRHDCGDVLLDVVEDAVDWIVCTISKAPRPLLSGLQGYLMEASHEGHRQLFFELAKSPFVDASGCATRGLPAICFVVRPHSPGELPRETVLDGNVDHRCAKSFHVKPRLETRLLLGVYGAV